MTEQKGGDTDSNLPIITLSKVSTSPGSPTLDPQGDIPRTDLSGEVRQLSGNSSSDESDRVYQCCPVTFTIVEGGLNTIVQFNRINTTK